jgi:hypothetical protein
MCFSASASFTAAAFAAAAGIVAISRHTMRGDLALAAMPLVLSVQQVIEGILWLELSSLPPGSSTQSPLGTVFLAIAQAWWPVFAPLSAILAEGRRPHRLMMFVALAGGIALSAHFLAQIASQPVSVSVAGSHLSYSMTEPAYLPLATAYLAVIAIPFMVSSHAPLRLLGYLVTAGAVISAAVGSEAFVSIWCFLAAVASCIIGWHFLRQERTASG